MSAPSSNHLHPRSKITTGIYAAALLAGTLALTGSLVRQLFWPIDQADPGLTQAAHIPWCTGELMSLRVELEEAMLQELASRSRRPELTRAEQVRRRSWDERLAEVSTRCQHSDLAKNSALGLKELAGRYGPLVDELHALRFGLPDAVDTTLSHLKND